MLSLLKYKVSSSILFPIRIKKQLQNPYFKLYQVICKRMAYFESELLFTAFIIFFTLCKGILLNLSGPGFVWCYVSRWAPRTLTISPFTLGEIGGSTPYPHPHTITWLVN